MTDKEINKYITAICRYLKETHGELQEEWKLTISILRQTLIRLSEVQRSIKENGIFNNDYYKKNPLLSTEKDLIAVVLKISQKLGISPWDQGKLNITEDEESPIDFINALTE